jgi:hypothetical protein
VSDTDGLMAVGSCPLPATPRQSNAPVISGASPAPKHGAKSLWEQVTVCVGNSPGGDLRATGSLLGDGGKATMVGA